MSNTRLSFDDENWDVPNLVPVPRWRLRTLSACCYLLFFVFFMPIAHDHAGTRISLFVSLAHEPFPEILLIIPFVGGFSLMGFFAAIACARLGRVPTILVRPWGNAIIVLLCGIFSFRFLVAFATLSALFGLPDIPWHGLLLIFCANIPIGCFLWPWRKLPSSVFCAMAAGIDSLVIAIFILVENPPGFRVFLPLYWLWPALSLAVIALAWVCLRPYREQRKREEEYRQRRAVSERIA